MKREISSGGGGVITALIILCSLYSSCTGQSCVDHFQADPPILQGYQEDVSVRFDDYSETTAVSTPLITVTWNDPLATGNPPDTGLFAHYFEIDVTTPQQWIISLKTTLEGLPDYPDVIVALENSTTFNGFSDFSTCTFTITVNLKDENTQTPQFSAGSYSVQIREDYPVDVIISDLAVEIQDNDNGSPNSDVTVTVDDGCPLQPIEENLSGFQGLFKPVDFILEKKLDFESQKEYTCIVTVTDKGSPSNTNTADLTITVKDMPDEPPVFEYEFYYATLDSAVPDAKQTDLTLEPANIKAVDGDQNNTALTYGLADVRPEVQGTTYFTIDPSTGIVSLVTAIDEEMLQNERLLFFITGTDESGDTSRVVLEITLPPVPTTTPEPSTTLSTTEFTCPPCTTADIWTSPTTTTTCEPCPTTDTPCPTLMTTAEGATCPPCSTVSMTECPSVTETQTCTPCPSTSFPTTIHVTKPPSLNLEFTKDSFVGEIYAAFTSVFTLSVVVEGVAEEDVIFSLDDTTYFDISSPSGEITVKSKPPEGIYNLTATASVLGEDTLTATTKVYIWVLTPSPDDLSTTESLYRVTVKEEEREEKELVVISTIGDAGKICITNVQPKAYKDHFLVENVGGWKLKKKLDKTIDYEKDSEITFKLQLFKEDTATCSEDSSIEMLRSEAMVLVNVQDVNDNIPVFIYPNKTAEYIAYPSDAALMSVVGPVITLQAKDDDVDTTIRYSIDTVNSGFSIDETSGEIFSEDQFNCAGQGCELIVSASDGEYSSEPKTILVKSLDMDHIYTLVMSNIDVSAVDSKLDSISQQIGATLNKVYVNPVIKSNALRIPKGRYYDGIRASYLRSSLKANNWQLQVNVYATDDEGNLMELDILNNGLTNAGLDEATAFADRDTFTPTQKGPTDTTGLKVAVGILAGLLGIVLIVAGYLVYKQRKSSAKKERKISTVGGAYPNLGYTGDKTDGSSTIGKMSNGVNGSISRTSFNHVGKEGKDSPPLYRSPLANNKDSTNDESGNSAQRGLRRTDPGSSEAFGSSSRSPPAAFKDPEVDKQSAASDASPSLYPSLSTTATVEDAPYLSSYSKRNKKTPPPLHATPAKSILRGGGGSDNHEAFPLTDVSLQKSASNTPDDPETDYDNPTSKFSALRSSPVLKRASSVIDSDHDEADNKSIKSYTSLDAKKSNLKHDKTDDDSEEEKKSVAFKVLVDTKTIEAENMGPAQKAVAQAIAQSDAIDILETNKKKLGDSPSDEDDDADDDEGYVRM